MQHSTQIVMKRLPKGWVYLLSKKDARTLAHAHPSSLRLVRYLGTGRKPSKILGGLSLGDVTAVPTDSGWVFRIELWGVPLETMDDGVQVHRNQLLHKIEEFLHSYEQEQSGAGLDPVRLGFYLDLGETGLELSFHERRLEALFLQFLERETWWR